ncbi:zinc finger and SCAN domain-containing protein 2-like isoform X1 [Chelonus insularis]|uniref:zinc finger and SCAN domain-containing protein 2-like isoform X1 n=1 Tax=Chelonus insularis TaxID=460826 RepID=UPI00158D0012|nr:zinc finger and SCAN domain-containing protein 2-like isoform X1 [Chelonus insularis]
MTEVPLYDSTICRLCAENNANGELLYTSEGTEPDLGFMVNRYLPLKIRDDGKLPRTICPGCNIQLEATVQFFDLLIDGQRKIRELWKQQTEQQKKVDRDRLKVERENIELSIETPEVDQFNDKNNQDSFAQEIVIKILPDGSMYAAEHDMSLQMEGLEKPRRKRGRPPKSHFEDELKEAEESQDISQEEEDKPDEEDDLDGDGRRRRKRKIPKRFSEVVQGKELERIFKEEGVIDDDDDGREYNDVDEQQTLSIPDVNEEVIGHLETEEGKDLGELVIVNKGRGRGRPRIQKKKNKFTCNLCGRGFLQRSRYIMHKSYHKNMKYECSECNKIFTNVDNFNLHQKTTGHSGEIIKNFESTNTQMQVKPVSNKPEIFSETSKSTIEKFTTDEIEKNENEADYNIDEVDDKSEPKDELESIECSQCNITFHLKDDYEIHMKEIHLLEKPYVCTICDKSFIFHSSLKGHVLTHDTNKTEKGYTCDICGKVLNHPSSVVYHKEAEHNNGRRFVCNKCGKSFKHKQLLQRHQLVHSDDRPYMCKSCNASFKTKANLINHQSTHTGEKKYSCEICNQQFAHKTSLTLHYRWHTGHKPYKCDICSKSFSQNGNLQEHMRIHTGEKPYSCDHCGRKFTTSSQFKLHVKRHTGERPWKCEFCAKSFLHKDTWKCHVRRHKGERPFQCAHCNRGFTEQWALKKHLRLHTGEKPYSCDVCGKAFADCSNLTKHKKVHREPKLLEINGIKPATNEELWQILPATQEGDENSLGEHITQVITTEEGSEDGVPQIIYVSYQDPDDPNQSRTLHFGMIEDKEAENSGQTLSTLEVEENEMISKHSSHTIHETDDQIGMHISDQSLQLQITDEEGNPIPLSIQDARQLLTDGELVSQLNNGQTIRVHSGVISEELAEQLGVHLRQPSNVQNSVNQGSTSTIDSSSSQTNTNAIVKVLTNNHETETVTADQTSEEAPSITDSEQAIEFTTEDGQKLRLVPSYHVDSLQLTSEYLTIV